MIHFTNPLAALESAQAGAVFEKTAIGWNVKWVDGGTVQHVQGATITEALGSHGAQVIHVIPEVRPDPRLIVDVIPEAAPVTVPPEGAVADVASDQTADTGRRALDQDAAVETAFVAAKLPEEDRRVPKRRKKHA